MLQNPTKPNQTKSVLPCRLGRQYTSTASQQWGKTSPNERPVYDTKQSDGEVPVLLELWEMQSTSSLQSLLGPHWPRAAVPERVLSMGQIEQNCVRILN